MKCWNCKEEVDELFQAKIRGFEHRTEGICRLCKASVDARKCLIDLEDVAGLVAEKVVYDEYGTGYLAFRFEGGKALIIGVGSDWDLGSSMFCKTSFDILDLDQMRDLYTLLHKLGMLDDELVKLLNERIEKGRRSRQEAADRRDYERLKKKYEGGD